MAGVFWLNEREVRAFPMVREGRGAGAVPTHTKSCCGPVCTAPQTQTVSPGRGSDDRISESAELVYKHKFEQKSPAIESHVVSCHKGEKAEIFHPRAGPAAEMPEVVGTQQR